VVFHIDDPGGGNAGYYRIGWTIAGDGTVETWTPPIPIPDGSATTTRAAASRPPTRR
jgi:hypothetical protein